MFGLSTIQVYISGALLLILATVGGFATYWRGEMKAAEAAVMLKQTELDAATKANEQTVAALAQVKAWREADNKTIAELQTKLVTINEASEKTLASLADLERGNAEIKSYLANVIPDALARLLNRPDPADGGGANDSQ